MEPTNDLNALLGHPSRGEQLMYNLMRDEAVSEITVNSWNIIYYTREGKRMRINEPIFRNREEAIGWIDTLLRAYTNSAYANLADAEGRTDVVEASLQGGDLFGSVHVVMPQLTRSDPIVTIRKQPRYFITIDQMASDGMMSDEMKLFLEMAMRGRLNILVSGGSGAGKTTMVRALSQFVDPAHRIITVEEIDELHLQLPNVVSMFTFTAKDGQGRLLWDASLDDLCRHALRMRPDRVWVGEVRGSEAYSLVKACTTGHDGSLTTVHSDTARSAVDNLVTYVMESGVTEDVARDNIVRAFDVIVHITKASYDRRVIAAISEVESAIEGKKVRMTPLFEYNYETDGFLHVGDPTPELERKLQRYGVNYRSDHSNFDW